MTYVARLAFHPTQLVGLRAAQLSARNLLSVSRKHLRIMESNCWAMANPVPGWRVRQSRGAEPAFQARYLSSLYHRDPV